jgi:hypothetical protein
MWMEMSRQQRGTDSVEDEDGEEGRASRGASRHANAQEGEP